MALSNTQNARLGAILSVMANEEVPEEYLKNLLTVMSKYPEYNKLLMDLIRILNRDDIM